MNNFPELARFYYEEVILRVRALGLSVLAQGVAAGEVRPEQAQFAARAMPSLLVMGSKMLHFFAPSTRPRSPQTRSSRAPSTLC